MSDHVNKTYKLLKDLRKRTDLKVKPNPYLRPEVQLRYYQIIGMLHLFMVKRLILGDDAGLGKTAETLAAYTTIKMKEPDLKLMIICPSSVMYQWASEINKFCIGITSLIVESEDIKYIDGVKLKSKDYLTGNASREHQFGLWESNDNDVLIFNYNTLGSNFNLLESLVKKHKFMVVFDECTSFKSTKSLTHENARQLSKICDRVYGLSATIIKNDLIEVFAIFRIIMPYVFGTETQFKNNYCMMEKKQLWKGKGKRGKVVNKIVGYKNLEFFNKAIDPYYLGRKKKDVAKDLPEIVARDIRIKMHPKQQEVYDDALSGFIDYDKFNLNKIKSLINSESDLELETRETKLIDKLTALIYCQQIANSPKTIEIDAPSAKEEELLRILETELLKEKVVIYSRFKRMVDRIESLITDKLKIPVLKITGDIDNRTREDYKNLFNTSDSHNIMLINAAAKEGVNLQSSGYLIFYDLPFSYGDFIQIVGRIHRIGSKHSNIFLLYMICQGTVDEKTYNILTHKKELFDAVLGDSVVGALKSENNNIVNSIFDLMIEEAKKL